MNFVLQSGNGFKQHIGYRGNNPYDPDIQLGTGQRSAMGWTQWTDIYTKCYVYACRITLVLNNISPARSGTVLNAPCARGYVQPARVYGTELMHDMVGQPDVRSFMLGDQNSPSGKTTIKWFKRTKDMFGTDTNLNDYTSQDASSIPNIQWFWNISLESPDSGVSTLPNVAVFGQIWIKYYCHFFDRRIQKPGQNPTAPLPAEDLDQLAESTQNTWDPAPPDRDVTGDGEII